MNDDGRIIRIENKIDHIADKISSIDATLASQHESLKYHIKRTDLLEKEVAPIKKHVIMVAGAIKLLGLICASVGLLAALAEILIYIRK